MDAAKNLVQIILVNVMGTAQSQQGGRDALLHAACLGFVVACVPELKLLRRL